MPAHDPDAPIPSEAAIYAITHLAMALAAAAGNACVRWPGSYTDREKSMPYILARVDGKNIRRSVRPLLCAGPGQVVMTCATPGCINPNHMRRVPNARPKDIGQSKALTSAGKPSRLPADYAPKTKPEDHPEIVRLVRAGLPQRDVAAKFGVSQSTISRIVRSA